MDMLVACFFGILSYSFLIRKKKMENMENEKVYYHLPGLFEFYDFYRAFLPVFKEHREYFYDWCEIGSVYGAPADCIWGGGRVELGDADSHKVFSLMRKYGISARLTFSNSLLEERHLSDSVGNSLCKELVKYGIQDGEKSRNGVIVHSELLTAYLKEKYPELYLVSSTTKVLTDPNLFMEELKREEIRFVVPDFRLNPDMDLWENLPVEYRDKVEFLCNECCWFGCKDRKACYEDVSRKNLGIPAPDHICKSPGAKEGYRFSLAMENPGFIGVEDIKSKFLTMGYKNFKIEGRGLGNAMLLEFILYYMTKPAFQIHVREQMYLDSMLDLF